MRKNIKRTGILVLALLCIVLGLAGIVLPVLQGVLFLAIDAVLLVLLFPNLRHSIERHTIRFPHIHSLMQKLENWITRVVGEV